MKLLLPLILLFSSFSAFSSGKTINPARRCQVGESCLVRKSTGLATKLINVEDEDGSVIGQKLSISSNLSDFVYPEANICTQGNSETSCAILDMMAGEENSEYTKGGHSEIVDLNCMANDNGVQVKFNIRSDYSTQLETINFQIPKCN